MNREEALDLLHQNLTTEHLVKHSLAVEAIMTALAEHLGQEPEPFALTGLLHDIDLDVVGDDMQRHSLVGSEMLAAAGLPGDVVQAVKVHNEIHGAPRQSLLDQALWAADPVSGFITAAALVRPDKSLANVEVSSLKKKFKEKSFARGASREQMKSCEALGLTLDDYLAIALASMKKIAPDLGL